MSKLNYYLKTNDGVSGRIMGEFCINGSRKRFSTKQDVPVVLWDEEKQRAITVEHAAMSTLNGNLDRIENEFNNYKTQLSNSGRLCRFNNRTDLLKNAMRRISIFMTPVNHDVVSDQMKSKVKNLDPAYVKARLKRNGWPEAIINDDLVQIHSVILKTKRALKTIQK